MNKQVIIKVRDLTKDYDNNRGVFDINFNLYKNETIGIVGENGAGKSTLLRLLMGFIKPDDGEIRIYGDDAYSESNLTKKNISYLPGEISFSDVPSGRDVININKKLYENIDDDLIESLINRFQFDINAYPKRMSKGMKQKTAIVLTFMKKSRIYFLDEPTTGLDPLMRDELLKLIKERQKEGSSVIMTSNVYEEIEAVSDRVLYLKEGRIILNLNMNELKAMHLKFFKITLKNIKDIEYRTFRNFTLINVIDNDIYVETKQELLNEFIKELETLDKVKINEIKFNLKNYIELHLRGQSYER